MWAQTGINAKATAPDGDASTASAKVREYESAKVGSSAGERPPRRRGSRRRPGWARDRRGAWTDVSRLVSRFFSKQAFRARSRAGGVGSDRHRVGRPHRPPISVLAMLAEQAVRPAAWGAQGTHPPDRVRCGLGPRAAAGSRSRGMRGLPAPGAGGVQKTRSGGPSRAALRGGGGEVYARLLAAELAWHREQGTIILSAPIEPMPFSRPCLREAADPAATFTGGRSCFDAPRRSEGLQMMPKCGFLQRGPVSPFVP